MRGTVRTILVVHRGWPQQENPALPLLAADAPAVLGGRVVTALSAPPVDIARLVDDVVARSRGLGLDLPATAVLTGVCDHAVAAGGDRAGSLRLVAADVGDATLVYALLTPYPLASAENGS